MSNSSYKYSPDQNYCNQARNFQSVLDNDKTKQKLIDNNKAHSPQDIQADRLGTLYSCPDNYKMGTIQDNQIYISTTDPQHDIIANDKKFKDYKDVPSPTGYFSDQATIDACKSTNGLLDNTAYNEATQIAPYRDNGIEGIGDASYKPHIDCFEIDRDALFKNYGTYDFNAAIAKCKANNQFGSGGGNQGYNPYISEMIDNGTLKYNASKSYSDMTISNSENCNLNTLKNSVVPEEKADKMYSDAQTRSQDCVNNNTPHPSSEACKNGFNKNDAIDVGCNTGNATPVPEQQTSSTNNSTVLSGELPPAQQPDTNNNPQISGTLPNQAQDIELPNNQADGKSGKDLADNLSKKNGGGFDPNNAIS